MGESVPEEGHTTDEGGTGFALAIVREIAEGHGRSVSVREANAGGAVSRFEGVATTGRTEVPAATPD